MEMDKYLMLLYLFDEYVEHKKSAPIERLW